MSLVSSQELTLEQTLKLQELVEAVPQILAETDHPEYDEIYGYRIGIDGADHVDTAIRNEILLKFLIATDYDVAAAQQKVVNTLNWRREFQVLSAAYYEKFDAGLEKMGVITEYPGNADNFRVVTWNLYANLKNPKKLFAKYGVGVTDDGSAAAENDKNSVPGTMFLRWRVGLMERSLSLLDFTNKDNNKAAQVHDYYNVSMFRMDPGMKAATKEIIQVFGDNYPEVLSKKYFINVPLLMGWIFTFFKATGLMSAATIKKFEMQNHGDLSTSFGKDNLPKEYNGGHENKAVPDIFALATVDSKIVVPEYGAILLQKLKDKSSQEASSATRDTEVAEEITNAA
ncbi:CRAL/TRIO domain-containing protein [Metschnikowia bicuspidata var. bicuspidata NRRL YB-4993]|uniref:Phosphatidylinositol transfer protein SFH5 n=1 Tax=Metschnikowia bicuspidata var. bicuspidata NRRL YB-4993 TaxID=869754 RepID=A0A1A0H7H7_9ASCO|nr:CRAL/TRIO domain-containing protein [Metschnikowia bicuspidata var. bicuspidata NRRL YB-4993]OBA19847.1 CRAL/TRIO domain-containing protein [Metschnikowia bicuspidata var. bicuspidata NRRL YB-4993]